ncbi:TonB-dependent receptor [Pseudothauera nasutitermitis]|uniref:TonB-dependent receptor n=1 Tax=Pseudothauera nasutitermitis TaxID=2565930 RepID=A0A4S4B3E7_9RHOO|nr:TonB-dependent receptor [Pseudothauera nasutitermitis]THF65424.1 TonB-dependent receptor [Pseudothauera nasutitermitis]
MKSAATPAFPRRRASSPLSIRILAAIGMLAGATCAHAQNDGVLSEVVVTASGKQQMVKDAPASISVITREELDKLPVSSAADAINRLEGVSVHGDSPNSADISIRGMPGEYTLILVDGKRQNTRETMNRGTGGVQANFLPPLDAIERIEVVRGPMGTLYGADAMGGVVNIITRKVPSEWHGSVTLSATRQEHSELGDSRQADFWVGGPIKADALGLQIYGQYLRRYEDDIYYARPYVSGAHGLRDRSIGAKLSAKLSDRQDLTLDLGTETFSHLREPGHSIAATAAATETRHSRDHFALTHEGRWSFGNSRVALSQEIGKQVDYTNGARNVARPEVTNTVLDGQLSLPFTRHLLRLGAQYQRGSVSGISQQDAIPGFPTANVDKVDIDSWALSVEDDFFLNERFTLTAGARLDHHDLYGSHWSPRLYGVYQLDDAWTLRGGIASGFKAPTLRQSVAGYCMTTGGNTPSRGNLCGNPNLDPETSLTQEFGVAWQWAPRASLSATVFNNDFKNKVASYDTGVVDPRMPSRTIYIYDNIDNVTIRGLEVALNFPLTRTLSFDGNYTYVKSKREGGGEFSFDNSSLDGKPLDKTPEHMVKAQLDWTPGDAFSAYLRANYYGKSYWAGFRNGAMNVRERPASATLDVGGQYNFSSALKLKFALLNVTDRMVAVDDRTRATGLDGNWLQDEGRRLWVALNASF